MDRAKDRAFLEAEFINGEGREKMSSTGDVRGIRDFGNVRSADHVRGGPAARRKNEAQNPGAISRYFNAQKAGPSLDRRCEGPGHPPLPKGPLIKTDSDARPVRHLVSARIPGLTARSKNNTDVNPIPLDRDRGSTGSRRCSTNAAPRRWIFQYRPLFLFLRRLGYFPFSDQPSFPLICSTNRPVNLRSAAPVNAPCNRLALHSLSPIYLAVYDPAYEYSSGPRAPRRPAPFHTLFYDL